MKPLGLQEKNPVDTLSGSQDIRYGLYVFYGNDPLTLEKNLQECIQSIVQTYPHIDIIHNGDTLDSLMEEVHLLSFFEQPILCRVHRDVSSKDWARLLEIKEKCFVLISLDKNTLPSFVKKEDCITIRHFPLLKPYEFERLFQKRFPNIHPYTLHILASSMQSMEDFHRICEEYDFYGDDLFQISHMQKWTKDNPIQHFLLVENLFSHPVDSMHLMKELFQEDPSLLSSMIYGMRNKVQQFILFHQEKFHEANLKTLLGLHPFVIKNIAQLARKYSLSQLEKLQNSLGFLEYRLRKYPQEISFYVFSMWIFQYLTPPRQKKT